MIYLFLRLLIMIFNYTVIHIKILQYEVLYWHQYSSSYKNEYIDKRNQLARFFIFTGETKKGAYVGREKTIYYEILVYISFSAKMKWKCVLDVFLYMSINQSPTYPLKLGQEHIKLIWYGVQYNTWSTKTWSRHNCSSQKPDVHNIVSPENCHVRSSATAWSSPTDPDTTSSYWNCTCRGVSGVCKRWWTLFKTWAQSKFQVLQKELCTDYNWRSE